MDTTNDTTTSEFFKTIQGNLSASIDFNQNRAPSPRAQSPSTKSKNDTPAGASSKMHDLSYSIITHQKKDHMKDDRQDNSSNSNNNNNNNSSSSNSNDFNIEVNANMSRSILDKKASNQQESPEELAYQIGRAAAIAAAQSKDNKDMATQIGVAAATYALNLLMNENNQVDDRSTSRPSSAQQRQSVKIRPQSAPIKNEFLVNGSKRMNEIEEQYTANRGINPPSKWQLSQGSLGLNQDSVASLGSLKNPTQMKTFDMNIETINRQSPSRPPSASRPSSGRPPSASRPSSASRREVPATNVMSPSPPFRPSPSKNSPSTISISNNSPKRSPREKNFTYTGIRRPDETNPYNDALKVKYKVVSNNIKQSSNDYGSFFKTVQKQKKKDEEMMEKYREYLKKQAEMQESTGIHVNPSHSQRSLSPRPPKGSPRGSTSTLKKSQTPRGRSPSPLLNQKLAVLDSNIMNGKNMTKDLTRLVMGMRIHFRLMHYYNLVKSHQ